MVKGISEHPLSTDVFDFKFGANTVACGVFEQKVIQYRLSTNWAPRGLVVHSLKKFLSSVQNSFPSKNLLKIYIILNLPRIHPAYISELLRKLKNLRVSFVNKISRNLCKLFKFLLEISSKWLKRFSSLIQYVFKTFPKLFQKFSKFLPHFSFHQNFPIFSLILKLVLFRISAE